MIIDVDGFGTHEDTTEVCLDALLEACGAFSYYSNLTRIRTSLHLGDLHPVPSQKEPDVEYVSLAAEVLLEYAFQVCGPVIGSKVAETAESLPDREDLPSQTIATPLEDAQHIGFPLAQFPQPPSFFAKSESTKSGYGKRHGVIFDFPRAGREL
ncbi:hypothetical protein E1B28_009142 [Marasmius oreades]|uniref:Uncharacterized protein n=1 Tax=Marasmius oreades TaxID=181124 RepID=A0A9P7S0G6_9AGAR|nr:uncharacterized protein E1B28_009142 [Marasmius oreades]KAG7092827.1 hypothetical protein E1B28_009142 [Marasmius oreades]